jgi:hypothetical protein
VRHPLDPELDAVVHESLGAHPRTDAGFLKEIGDAVFDDAGSHTVLHVVETARLDDHGVDAVALEKVSEQQSGGTGANDDHLRAN